MNVMDMDMLGRNVPHFSRNKRKACLLPGSMKMSLKGIMKVILLSR